MSNKHYFHLFFTLFLLVPTGFAVPLTVGPFVGVTYNGLHANANPTVDSVNKDLTRIGQSFDYIRTYYPQYGGGSIKLTDLARQKNLKMLVGFYLFDNSSWSNGDYENILKPALLQNKNQDIIGVLVGNEDPHQKKEIKTYIDRIHKDAPNIPVSTAQTNAFWLSADAADLAPKVDFIAVNIYPSWCWNSAANKDHLPSVNCTEMNTIVKPENAFASFLKQFNEMKAKYPNKQIVVTETGYPTNFGNPASSADTSTARAYACQYLQKISAWAQKEKQLVFMYEMFDSQVGVNTSSGFNYHFGLHEKFPIPDFNQHHFPHVNCITP